MNLINRVTQFTETMMSSSKARVEDFRNDRRRNELLQELGGLKYREHSGETIKATAVESILAELDRLAASHSHPATTEKDEKAATDEAAADHK